MRCERGGKDSRKCPLLEGGLNFTCHSLSFRNMSTMECRPLNLPPNSPYLELLLLLLLYWNLVFSITIRKNNLHKLCWSQNFFTKRNFWSWDHPYGAHMSLPYNTGIPWIIIFYMKQHKNCRSVKFHFCPFKVLCVRIKSRTN
jgi:hypothetical protein